MLSWETHIHISRVTQKEGDCVSLRIMSSVMSQQAATLICIGFTSKSQVSWAQAMA
jgi:hypothetical protein